MLDAVVAGGLVIDGAGAPGRVEDIGLEDGRVVARGDAAARGLSFQAVPVWKDLVRLPVPEQIAKLRDPEFRKTLFAAAADPESGYHGKRMSDWAEFLISQTFSPANAGLEGQTVGEVAKQRGQQPFDTWCDVVIADDLETGLIAPGWRDEDQANWEVRAESWLDNRTVIGGSDAGAVICGAIYTTHMLGESVRERQLLTLEQGVHELADVPARRYGLRDRGRIEVGALADLTLFDPETVAPGIERQVNDLPGNGTHLFADATSIQRVMVSEWNIRRGRGYADRRHSRDPASQRA
jgi:N-acyl-D-aspartate/D-glutamate deacylase